MEPIQNKKAKFKYSVQDVYTAGIVLNGWEVKPILARKVNLENSHIIIKNGEMYVLNMLVAPEVSSKTTNNFIKLDSGRTRKLLLKKKEIMKLMGQVKEKGFTLVPLKIFLLNNKVKLEIALVRGKNEYDKRENMKERDTNRELARVMKKSGVKNAV